MAARNVSPTDRLGDAVDRQVEAEEAVLGAIRVIAREGREAIGRGEFLLIDGEQARADLFRCLRGREAPWAAARDGGGDPAPRR